METRLRWVAERVDNGAGLDDEPTIRHLMRSIGEASDGLGIRVREGTNAAQLFVELSPSEHRKVDTPTLIEHWREAVEGVPYVTSINFDYSLNRPGADIEVALSSRDDEILAAAAAALKERLGRYPGVHEVSDSERPPRDEIQFSLRNEAQALGLTSLDLARQVRQGFLGETVDSPRFLVVENGCRFFQELRFPDLIHAGLRCGRIGTSSFTLELALFRGTSEEAAATGFFAQVQVDAQSHRPSPLDAPRRALLEAIG